MTAAKLTYMTPDFELFEIRADERFTATGCATRANIIPYDTTGSTSDYLDGTIDVKNDYLMARDSFQVFTS